MQKLNIILLTIYLACFQTPVQAMSDNGGGSPYEMFELLIEEENYEEAVKKLNEALTEWPEDAELLNLIAYSHRQLKHYEIAQNYYLMALEIEPSHRGANAYLGELYLHFGQLDKALERRDVIDDDCFFRCAELKELEAAIEEYRKQNPS